MQLASSGQNIYTYSYLLKSAETITSKRLQQNMAYLHNVQKHIYHEIGKIYRRKAYFSKNWLVLLVRNDAGSQPINISFL